MRTKKELINLGLICPYCEEPTKLVDSELVYGKSYGLIYICLKDKAWVGVHKNKKPVTALGRLANEELRKYKRKAHEYFDHIWKLKMARGFSKYSARSKAYKWLSKELNIPEDETHIGFFDKETCKKVINICKPYYNGRK